MDSRTNSFLMRSAQPLTGTSGKVRGREEEGRVRGREEEGRVRGREEKGREEEGRVRGREGDLYWYWLSCVFIIMLYIV